MHALALPLLEDLLPQLLAHHLPGCPPSAANGGLAECLTALASPVRAYVSASVSTEVATMPGVPLLNMVALLCKMRAAIPNPSGFEVRNDHQFLKKIPKSFISSYFELQCQVSVVEGRRIWWLPSHCVPGWGSMSGYRILGYKLSQLRYLTNK